MRLAEQAFLQELAQLEHLSERLTGEAELVQRAQRIVGGVEPQKLRDNQDLRQDVASQLSGVQSVLDGLLVDRPRGDLCGPPDN